MTSPFKQLHARLKENDMRGTFVNRVQHLMRIRNNYMALKYEDTPFRNCYDNIFPKGTASEM